MRLPAVPTAAVLAAPEQSSLGGLLGHSGVALSCPGRALESHHSQEKAPRLAPRTNGSHPSDWEQGDPVIHHGLSPTALSGARF